MPDTSNPNRPPETEPLSDILKREFEDEEYRVGYVESHLDSAIASQIVVLREQRGLTQAGLAELIGTKQPSISRLEDCNYSAWSVPLLKRIARALGVRLKVSFESFDTFDDDLVFSRESLERPEFQKGTSPPDPATRTQSTNKQPSVQQETR